MMGVKAIFLAFTLLAAELPHVLSSPATVPAFLWSRFNQGLSDEVAKEAVNYQIILPSGLAKIVLTEGGWSSFICFGSTLSQTVDVALVFIGKELQTSDISRGDHQDRALLDLLKLSFMSSNASVAFPYVAVSNQKGTVESSLLSGFNDYCEHGMRVKNIAYMQSCSLEGPNLKNLGGLQAFQGYIDAKKESGISDLTDLIFFCAKSPETSLHSESEGKVLSYIVELLEQSGLTYTILYASDPSYRSCHSTSHLAMRFLVEGNSSTNSTLCDAVCQLKSSLFEGLFVAIVLLIILISGLCCMMGIDTPTRFESSPES
ncbi:hypothetical protein HPP92_020833 [Vanilla planifolia]|uniref:V-type proton ATPase subunit S1/VOA1 transmembrane domain-containing protein n=1 Tax=Vanilla planifolia TaxID=51239 RepID=A0A835Q6R9_VANPL|nr:hypothetical protein HPP92_020833 [Vanilla planifolia]